MGRLVPAGTGMPLYRGIGVQIDAPEELLAELQQEETPIPVRPAPAAAEPDAAAEEVSGDLIS
jgi:hypothetical protein